MESLKLHGCVINRHLQQSYLRPERAFLYPDGLVSVAPGGRSAAVASLTRHGEVYNVQLTGGGKALQQWSC